MQRKKVTLSDIAQAAGVSVSTVGRVLNGMPGVSLARRRLVVEAARELGAGRMPAAAAHVRLRVLVVRLSIEADDFFKKIDAALDQAAASLSPHLELVRVTQRSARALGEVLRQLRGRFQGAIILAHDTREVRAMVEKLARQALPLVTLSTDLTLKAPRHFVGIDNLAAGRTAAWMLGRLAPRSGRVLLLTGSQDYDVHRLRTQGFEDALALHAPQLQLVGPVDVGDLEDRALQATRQALRRPGRIVAIYNSGGANQGMLQAVQELPPDERPVCISHEATARHLGWLREGQLALLIDQDPQAQAMAGLQIVLQAHGEIACLPELTVPFRLLTPENSGALK